MDAFIATAAYGSYFEDHVKILRQLRDDILLHSGIGKAFVAAYYKTSPPIADFIAEHDALRTMVRWGLAPVVGLSWVALNHGTFAALALMFYAGAGEWDWCGAVHDEENNITNKLKKGGKFPAPFC